MAMQPASTSVRAFRGSILHFFRDPGAVTHEREAYEHFADGVLLVRDGTIVRIGDAAAMLPTLPPHAALIDYRGQLLLPGFVDVHVHYPQTDIIASYGERLLDWLERYAFPAERRFDDAEHAGEVAEFFLDELLRNGTTTACAFATIHPASVDALFAAAQRRRMRLIAGKVMMDRNAPAFLRDTAQESYRDSAALIRAWHGRDRLAYALTPRFAPTSSVAQLEFAARLFADHPGVYVQTHLAENREEVGWVTQLFPEARSYLDVYERSRLLGARSVYAHCLHLDDEDRARMGQTRSAMAFCPTSNLFLGSGLFDLDAAHRHGVRVGIGTDVGGGTSFNMLRTLSEAYKVVALTGQRLAPMRAFYLATLGGAVALDLDDRIGNFLPGKEADFIALDLQATPLLARRMARCESLAEQIFALMMLGDDRAIARTHVLGECVYERR